MASTLTSKRFGSRVVVRGTHAAYTTVDNAYADVPNSVTYVEGLLSKRLLLTCTTKDLLAQVLGSMDGGSNYDVTLVEEFKIVQGGDKVLCTFDDLVTHYKIQVKPDVADQHGVISGVFMGSTDNDLDI